MLCVDLPQPALGTIQPNFAHRLISRRCWILTRAGSASRSSQCIQQKRKKGPADLIRRRSISVESRSLCGRHARGRTGRMSLSQRVLLQHPASTTRAPSTNIMIIALQKNQRLGEASPHVKSCTARRTGARPARSTNSTTAAGYIPNNRHINIELSVQQPEQQTTIKTEYNFQSEFW